MKEVDDMLSCYVKFQYPCGCEVVLTEMTDETKPVTFQYPCGCEVVPFSAINCFAAKSNDVSIPVWV